PIFVLIAHRAATLLDDVAVAAAVPEDEPLALEHGHLLLALAGKEFLRGPLADLPLEESEDGKRFLVGEVELRHLRLDALVGENARRVQLLPDPVGVGLVVPGVLGEEAHVAKVQYFQGLAAVLSQ